MTTSSVETVHLVLCHHEYENADAVAAAVPLLDGRVPLAFEYAFCRETFDGEEPRGMVGAIQNDLLRFADNVDPVLETLKDTSFIAAVVRRLCADPRRRFAPLLVDVARELDTQERHDLALQAVSKKAVAIAWRDADGDPAKYLDIRAQQLAASLEYREEHVADQLVSIAQYFVSPVVLIMGADHYFMTRKLSERGMEVRIHPAQPPSLSAETAAANVLRSGISLNHETKTIMGLSEWLCNYKGLPDSAVIYDALRDMNVPHEEISLAAKRMVESAELGQDFELDALPETVKRACAQACVRAIQLADRQRTRRQRAR